MKHSTDELRAALHDYAEQFTLDRPSATVEDVQQRMASARRRAVGTIAGVAIAAAVVTGVVVTQPGDSPAPTPRPAGTRTSHPEAAARFPQYTAGLKLLTVARVPLAADAADTRVSVQGATGAQLFAIAWCPDAKLSGTHTRWAQQANVKASRGGSTARVTCLGTEMLSSFGVNSAVGLPPNGSTITLHGGHVPGARPPRGAEARVAIYEEVPWTAYPFAKSRSIARDGAGEDEGTPLRTITPPPGATNQPVTVTLHVPGDVVVRVSATGPGQIKALVNGRPLSPATLVPPNVPAWQRAAAGYRGNWASFWDKDGGQQFLLWRAEGRQQSSRTTAAKGEQVTITVQPRRFTSGSWTVELHEYETRMATASPEKTVDATPVRH